MNAEAFLTLLHGLITPGLAVHRRRLGLPPTAKALLLVDAWTGFHAFKHGEDCARSAWAVQACCELSKQQACFTTNERRIFHMDVCFIYIYTLMFVHLAGACQVLSHVLHIYRYI